MYYYGYGLDLGYLAIVFVSLVLGGLTQAYINRSYRRWSQVSATAGATGEEVARRMLDSEGASAVGITLVPGHLTDYYDPRDNNLHLSQAVRSPRWRSPATRQDTPSRLLGVTFPTGCEARSCPSSTLRSRPG